MRALEEMPLRSQNVFVTRYMFFRTTTAAGGQEEAGRVAAAVGAGVVSALPGILIVEADAATARQLADSLPGWDYMRTASAEDL